MKIMGSGLFTRHGMELSGTFKPGGGCDTNTTPSSQANGLDERCASQLTQHNLFTECTHLKQLLG